MRLLLLRHGQTTSNVAGALDTGRPGAALTDLGWAQARAAGRVLQEEGIEGVFVSSLLRTHQTAEPYVTGVGATQIEYDGLREIGAGDHEMKTDTESVQHYLRTVSNWIVGQHTHRMAGGETGEEFLARYDECIDAVVASGTDNAVVVSHGAAIRTWVGARVIGTDDPRWEKHAFTPLHNTGGIHLERTPRGWEILDWSSDPIGGHYLDDPTAPDPTGR